MNWHASSLENLRRIFVDGFTARDIAEPLASFDASTPAAAILALAQAKDFDVVGIRDQGHVIGYVTREELDTCSGDAPIHPLEEATVISDSAALSDVIVRLKDAPRLFMRTLGAIHGIVTQSDLQKPAVRMWLFGMVTLVEMRMSRLIEQLCPAESWKQFLSEGRLEKAAALLEERRRRSQNLALLDCLQFADKVQIVARNDAIRSLTRFASRREVEKVCTALENLRNSLAHAQDIITNDWPTIVMLAGDLDGVLAGTNDVQQALGEGG